MAAASLRETVLRAAVDHIAEHGADSLSFRQLASAAGVSHQAPYHHSADRTGIFHAIALEGFAMFAAALRDAAQRTDVDTATALLAGYVNFAVEHTGHFRVLFRSDLTHIGESPELAAVADESFDVLVDHVQQVLGADATVDEIRSRVTTMWSLAHGLATLLIDGPLEHKLGSVVDRQSLIVAVAAESGLTAPRDGHR